MASRLAKPRYRTGSGCISSDHALKISLLTAFFGFFLEKHFQILHVRKWDEAVPDKQPSKGRDVFADVLLSVVGMRLVARQVKAGCQGMPRLRV